MGCWFIPWLLLSIEFADTHLYSWVESGTEIAKCLAQEHNKQHPWPELEPRPYNMESHTLTMWAPRPHITLQCISCSNKLWMKMYLLKPLWFFHLVNKAQVCFCTGTSGTLKLLETRSYRSDVWKLRRNRMAKTQQIQIDVNNRQLTHPDRLRLCRIQEPNV